MSSIWDFIGPDGRWINPVDDDVIDGSSTFSPSGPASAVVPVDAKDSANIQFLNPYPHPLTEYYPTWRDQAASWFVGDQWPSAGTPIISKTFPNDVLGGKAAGAAAGGLDSVAGDGGGAVASGDLYHQALPQNANSVGMPITNDERAMANAGNVEGFWRARQAQGDPIADIALTSLHSKGGLFDAGGALNRRLDVFSRLYTGHKADIDAIRTDLMKEHMNAVDADTSGITGLLDPGQVYDYHQPVFTKHGLPMKAFGGSPFTGSRWETFVTRPIWCSQCDH